MWNIISGTQLDEYLEEQRDMFLVDLRDPASYQESHIAGARNIPEETLMERLWELPKDKMIVLYCYHGPGSMRAARRLARMGYDTADVYGGIQGYRGKYLVQMR